MEVKYQIAELHNVSIFGSRPWAIDYHNPLTECAYSNKRRNKQIIEHLDYAQPIRKDRDFRFEYMTRPEVNLTKPKQEVSKRVHRKVFNPKTQPKESQYNFAHPFVYEFNQPKETKDESLRMSPYAKMLFANKGETATNAKLNLLERTNDVKPTLNNINLKEVKKDPLHHYTPLFKAIKDQADNTKDKLINDSLDLDKDFTPYVINT